MISYYGYQILNTVRDTDDGVIVCSDLQKIAVQLRVRKRFPRELKEQGYLSVDFMPDNVEAYGYQLTDAGYAAIEAYERDAKNTSRKIRTEIVAWTALALSALSIALQYLR